MMDVPPFNYNGFFPQDGQTYHGQSISSDFEPACVNVDFNFDVDSSSQEVAFWGPPTMQRFLKDPQRAPLFNPMPQTQLPGVAQPVTPIHPAASHGRQGSPFSSNDPSSCSSAQSPPTETELYTENSPSTPPDISLSAPYSLSLFDQYEPQHHLFLAGTGDISGQSLPYVSMLDVNPTVESQLEWEDSPHALDFNSPQRSFTYGSQASGSTDMESMASQEAVNHGYTHMASPEEMPTTVKNEIQIPKQAAFTDYSKNGYPTPSDGESENELEGEINIVTQQSDDDDDDDDYRPSKKRILTVASRRASRPKRDAPKKPLEGAISKKARTTPSAPQPARILPPPNGGGKGPHPCRDCHHAFKDENTLQVHIKKQHTRPFICVFKFAGCESTFASKNEWKRHVMSQHLLLHYWLCDLDVCADNKNNHAVARPASGKRSRVTANRRGALAAAQAEPFGPPLPDGAIFNRKDLYTQHLRRMHTPLSAKNLPSRKSSKKTHLPSLSLTSSSSSSCKSSAEWDDHIKQLQSKALRERCHLPQYMECPAPNCTLTFSGADAWDQRMEHVAKHLEMAATGEEGPVVFGGPSDQSLMNWATGPEVAVVKDAGDGRWVLNNPLRSAGDSRGGGGGGGGVGKKRATSSISSSPAVSVRGNGERSPDLESAKSEIVVESDDEDAEGEEE